jgi:hypothetical protein
VTRASGAARGLAMLAAVALTACAGLRSEAPEPGTRPDSVYIEAINDHFYEARIHAIYAGGQRQTLGTVPGNGGHARLTMPWEPRALTFQIMFVVSNATYQSVSIDVNRNERIELRVPPNIDASGFFRRIGDD